MKENEPWDRFANSGKIEDYLLYAGSSESPNAYAAGIYQVPGIGAAGVNSTPELGIASIFGFPGYDDTAVYNIPRIDTSDMVAMNNATELSGIGGMNTFGINNMPAMARQEELNGDAAVRDNR